MGRVNGAPGKVTKNTALYNKVRTAQVQVIPLKEAKARLIADLREQGKLA